jgi:lipopolysaccharide transport system ATP-binding protein
VRPDGGEADGDEITVETPLLVEIVYRNYSPGCRLGLRVELCNAEGVSVFSTAPVREPTWNGREFPAGVFRSSFRIPGNLLNDGTYRVEVQIVQDQAIVLSKHDDLLSFEVHDGGPLREGWFGKWVGAIRPDLDWRTDLVEGDEHHHGALPASLSELACCARSVSEAPPAAHCSVSDAGRLGISNDEA